MSFDTWPDYDAAKHPDLKPGTVLTISHSMSARYVNEREALRQREGEMVEVTRFGGPVEFLNCGTTAKDFQALAERAYLRGDLTVEEFEAELDALFSLG